MLAKHFIYGVPGVGKSTLSANFAEQHNLMHLELDKLRPEAQKVATRQQEPFVYEYTTEAWKKFGELLTNEKCSEGWFD